MKHKNMDRQKEYECDRARAMQSQHNRKPIQDHAEQAGGEGKHDRPQQQPTLCSQLPAIHDGMDDAEQQKQDGCHFVNMDTGKREHNGHDEADKQCDIE